MLSKCNLERVRRRVLLKVIKRRQFVYSESDRLFHACTRRWWITVGSEQLVSRLVTARSSMVAVARRNAAVTELTRQKETNRRSPTPADHMHIRTDVVLPQCVLFTVLTSSRARLASLVCKYATIPNASPCMLNTESVIKFITPNGQADTVKNGATHQMRFYGRSVFYSY